MALASALCPTGKVRPCLAISSPVLGSSSTDRAATLIPVPPRLSLARWKDRSCALQYGHHAPRKNSTTPKSPVNASGTVRAGPPGGVSEMAGNEAPGLSSGITALLDLLTVAPAAAAGRFPYGGSGRRFYRGELPD